LGVTTARPDPAFWFGRRVLVTGHTGFKGAWVCLLLERLGANVTGIALPAIENGAFDAMRPLTESNVTDIRDAAAVTEFVRLARPEIVLHLAAQALVGEGHLHPLETFATNVMGTANLLDALRGTPAMAALVVTSDKVYRTDADRGAFTEDSPLGGTDPYSASKVAAEYVVSSWRPRLREAGCQVATARAGNVLGGGDWGAGRLVPDVIRAHRARTQPKLRRPEATRPWQYVLDVLGGYLLFVEAMCRGDAPPTLNFGPDPDAACTAAELTERLQRALGATSGWQAGEASFAETTMLRLDAGRAARVLEWRTVTDINRAVGCTAAWHEAAWRGDDMRRAGMAQIEAWFAA
jgi:CDP-glucose 4,6-dehydratase